MDTDFLAAALAGADNEVQGKFLSALARHLKLHCRERCDTQLSYIADALNEHGRWLATELGKYAELAAESRESTERAIRELRSEKYALEDEVRRLQAARDMSPATVMV